MEWSLRFEVSLQLVEDHFRSRYLAQVRSSAMWMRYWSAAGTHPDRYRM